MTPRYAISMSPRERISAIFFLGLQFNLTRHWANVLRPLDHLQKLEHSNGDDIAHDFVAFEREM